MMRRQDGLYIDQSIGLFLGGERKDQQIGLANIYVDALSSDQYPRPLHATAETTYLSPNLCLQKILLKNLCSDINNLWCLWTIAAVFLQFLVVVCEGFNNLINWQTVQADQSLIY